MPVEDESTEQEQQSGLVFHGRYRDLTASLSSRPKSLVIELVVDNPPDEGERNRGLTWSLGGSRRRTELGAGDNIIVTYDLDGRTEFGRWVHHPATGGDLGDISVIHRFDQEWRLKTRVSEGDPVGPVIQQVEFIDGEKERLLRFKHLLVPVPLPRLVERDGYASLYLVVDYDDQGNRQEVRYGVELSQGSLKNHLDITEAELKRLSGSQEEVSQERGSDLSGDEVRTQDFTDTDLLYTDYQEILETMTGLEKIAARMAGEPRLAHQYYPPKINLTATLKRIMAVGDDCAVLVNPVAEAGELSQEIYYGRADAYERLGVEIVDWGLLTGEARESIVDLHSQLIDLMRSYPEYFRYLIEERNRDLKRIQKRWRDESGRFFQVVDPDLLTRAIPFGERTWLSSKEQFGLILASLDGVFAREQRNTFWGSLVDEDRKWSLGRRSLKITQVYTAFKNYEASRLAAQRTEALLFGPTDVDINAYFTGLEYRELAESIIDDFEDWQEETSASPDQDFEKTCKQWEEWFRNHSSQEIATQISQKGHLPALQALKKQPELVPLFLTAVPGLIASFKEHDLGP